MHPDPNLQKHHNNKGFLSNAGAGLAGAGLGAGLLGSVLGHVGFSTPSPNNFCNKKFYHVDNLIC